MNIDVFKKEIKKILIDKTRIEKTVTELASALNRDYAGEQLIVVCVLKGASVFTADLIRKLNLDIKLDFIIVSSYFQGSASSGRVELLKDVSESIEGKNILLVEDIIDTGLTMSLLKDNLLSRQPKSLKVCALLDKPARRATDFTADYVGFTVDNEFLVGYGLDYAGRYRNLPEICVLSSEVYGG